jgi:pseudaminic acid biosynthesis-associated methylase
VSYRTEQEAFWAGKFGDAYLERNVGEQLVRGNTALFSRVLQHAPGVKSIREFGCNIGLNLIALHQINPAFELSAYEINRTAAQRSQSLGIANVWNQSILDDSLEGGAVDLCFTKGVLIHINPDELDRVYANLVAKSKRYVLVCEYYNPTPVSINYRGESDKLFKRDFAGELMDRHHLRLVDYGFVYRRDNLFPLDDPTWFLMEKV